MITREGKLLKYSMVLAFTLLLLAPLASFAGSWGVSVGFGARAPGYVWVPGSLTSASIGNFVMISLLLAVGGRDYHPLQNL